jgi:FMNH2-dependent dimethyl sulfone monooxygenase
MQFGLYAPIPMATVGSAEIAKAHAEACNPLPDGTRDLQLEHSVALLEAADRSGFDLCLFAERHLGTDLSAWLLAGAVGSRLEHIRALVAIHPGLLDPVMTAKMSVSLDRMCKGGMALNIVNGWFDEEFEMFGGTILRGEERYRRASEFIAVLRGLWENEKFSFKGQFFNYTDAHLLLRPGHARAPEIFSVSAGDEGRDFIAQTCDWWFINYPKTAETTDDVMRGVDEAITDMRRRAERDGRKVRFGMNPFVAIGPDEETGIKDTLQKVLKFDPEPDERKLQRRMLPALKAGLIGRPEKILKQIDRYRDLGLELILCKMIPDAENISLIGREIVTPAKQLH